MSRDDSLCYLIILLNLIRFSSISYIRNIIRSTVSVSPIFPLIFWEQCRVLEILKGKSAHRLWRLVQQESGMVLSQVWPTHVPPQIWEVDGQVLSSSPTSSQQLWCTGPSRPRGGGENT